MTSEQFMDALEDEINEQSRVNKKETWACIKPGYMNAVRARVLKNPLILDAALYISTKTKEEETI